MARDYFGAGAIGEMAAHLMGQMRRVQTVQDQNAARLDEADARFRQFHVQLDCAAAAHLIAAGYHRRDRGAWRKRRNAA